MSKKTKLGILLTGASLAAMGAFAPAAAQETTDEIVVTATGRSAAIQDVPLAVTAVGGETLQNSGVQDLRDVTQLVPGLQFGTGQSNASGTIARIRGIGTGSDNPGFEGAVGIFIDGVYRARAGSALSDLPDLVRVEVLRGPQGTLFGRNTSAGAISVITAGPDHELGGYLEGMLGFDDLEEGGIRAGINLPAGDNLAFRIDGSIRARDGYITDVISGDQINDRDRWTGRAQMLWDISNDASLRIIVDAAETDEVCCGITPLSYGAPVGPFPFGVPQVAINTITGGAGTIPINVEARNMTVTPGRSYGEQTEEFGVSAELSWDLGFANFTSITSQRDWDAVRDQDIDFNVIDIAYRDGLEVGFENFTQEFRLQGEAGRLDWLIGAFYGDEKMNYNDTIRTGAHSSIYANTVAIIATQSLNPGVGCELYPVNNAVPSLFQCLASSLAPLNPALLGEVNSINATSLTNAGHLSFNGNGDGQQADNWTVNTRSWSLFTHNEFSITDALVLTVGVRYNNDEKELTADLNSVSPSCTSLQAMEAATLGITTPAGFFPGGIVSLLQQPSSGAASLMNLSCNPAVNTIVNGDWAGDRDEQEWSGTASLAYHLSDDAMLYGGYSRGYKAGGYNVDRSGFQGLNPATISAAAFTVDSLSFEPEFTDAYEVGLKSTILGGSTTFNINAFYQMISDYQLNAFNGFNFITQNVPEVISQGAEIELSSRPTDNLTINFGVVYTDAYYDSTVVFNPITPAGNTVASGDPLSFAPEWVVTAGIGYEQPIGDNLKATFYIDGRWNSEYRTQTLARPASGITDNDAFATFNARIGFGGADDRWRLELWSQNLTDEFYYVGAFSPPLQDGTLVIYPSQPQTYGITLRARY